MIVKTSTDLLDEYARIRRPQMCRWARQILNCSEDVDDCVQIALTRAAATIHRYDPAKGEFGAWLHRYVHRAALNHLRRRKPEVMMGLLVIEAQADQNSDVASQVADEEEQNQLLARAERILCLLPPDVQEALWKVSRGEMAMDEVARMMECTPNAAAVRLFRVRRTVKSLVNA